MSDPVGEAAKRAVEPYRISPYVGHGRHALRGALEALKPLRRLHKPLVIRAADGRSRTVCEGCDPDGNFTWPCPSAELIYSLADLEVES